jgi:hypothetical protein
LGDDGVVLHGREMGMSLELAAGIWTATGAYAGVGAAVWVLLMLGGFRRIDPLAAKAPFLVKLIWAPGVIALWPIMVLRLFVPSPERKR